MPAGTQLTHSNLPKDVLVPPLTRDRAQGPGFVGKQVTYLADLAVNSWSFTGAEPRAATLGHKLICLARPCEVLVLAWSMGGQGLWKHRQGRSLVGQALLGL